MTRFLSKFLQRLESYFITQNYCIRFYHIFYIKIKFFLKFLKIRKLLLLQNLLISSFPYLCICFFQSINKIVSTNIVSLFRQSRQVTGRLHKRRATLLSMQIRENNPIYVPIRHVRTDANTSQRDKMQRDVQSSDIHGIAFKNDMNSTWALDGGFPDLYNGPSEARRAVTFDYK